MNYSHTAIRIVTVRLCGLLLFCLTSAVHANLIEWQLNGNLLNNRNGLQEGIATGSFIYDADSGMFSSITLTTSAESPSGGLTFTQFEIDSIAGLVFSQIGAPSEISGTNLVLSNIHLTDLTNAGGILDQSGGFLPWGSMAEASCSFNCESLVAVLSNWGTGASLIGAPIPIPAAVWLFGSGLIGLIGVARRKKS